MKVNKAMNNDRIKVPFAALLINIALTFALFTITRLVFVACNSTLYADHMTTGYLLELMAAGLRFDCTAILYLNSLTIVAFLLPLHWKERSSTYYEVLRWIYVVTNFIGLSANLCDCAYYPYTGRRTTWNVLQEFSNEGNFFTIIVHEALPYWYLFPLALVLTWLLWKGFRNPTKLQYKYSNIGSIPTYYITMAVLLAVSVGLSIGGIRGGFTTATRPITISNANQYVERAIDAGIVLNTPFSILRTIGDKAFEERNYMTAEEAERLYSPVHVPADSVKFTPRNVVILIMESFGKEPQAKGYMPFVDSLAHVGVSFKYSYASGRKSIDGMPSVLSSIPSFVEPFFLTPAALNDLTGIAGELSRNKGYESAFFHGAQNGSMGFQSFAKATGFQKYYGRTEYNEDPRYHGDDDFDGTWAIWDEEFLQFYCDKMSEMKQPFVTSVFTASSHPPYAMPERYQKRFPRTNPPLFGCISYSDNALRLFFDKAKKQKWYDNTIFVITADHASSTTGQEYTTDIGVFSVPIVIFAPGMPQLNGVDTEKIMSQADIMPTILGLLGYDHRYIAFGQDVLNTPAEDTFATNYLTGNGYFQFIQGDWLIQFDGESVAHAYRFKDDPLLKKDLKDRHPKEYEMRIKSIVQQYMYRMNHNQVR